MKKSNISPQKKGITIAVVGPHYAGKSTLCRLFQEKKGYETVKEEWWNDPYRKANILDLFRSQIWYFTQTTASLIKARQLNKKGKNVILDTFFYSTVIFAESVLNERDFKVFYEMVMTMESVLPEPDVLIYLYADTKFLYDVRRGIRVKEGTGPPEESQTPYPWFEQVCKLNHKYFDDWTKTPLIKLDVQTEDILQDQKVFEQILKKIDKINIQI